MYAHLMQAICICDLLYLKRIIVTNKRKIISVCLKQQIKVSRRKERKSITKITKCENILQNRLHKLKIFHSKRDLNIGIHVVSPNIKSAFIIGKMA